MYENVCYKNNYLDEVICRLDFVSPITEFNQSMPKAIYDIVKRYYPIAEPQDVIGTALSINPVGAPTVNQIISKQWVFFARDRKNKCTIESSSIIFSISNYIVFEDLSNAINDILSILMKLFPESQGKRLGLRYVNKIPLRGHNNWIEDKFFVALSAHKDDKTTKLLTTLEYAVIEKDLNVRLLYGFDNPDYPAVMKREQFIIDIDAYSSGIIYQEDVPQYIDDMHFEVQKCFENMITEDFRASANSQE